jgi:hypothetical protein
MTIRTEEKVCTGSPFKKQEKEKQEKEKQEKQEKEKQEKQDAATSSKTSIQYDSKCPHGVPFYACPCCSQ